MSNSSKHAVIGREFLTWLYFQSDSHAGRVEAGGELFELWLDRKVTLEDDSIEPAELRLVLRRYLYQR